MNEFRESVLKRLYMLHAKPYGDNLIRKISGIPDDRDSIEWCKKQLKKKSVRAELSGKNWYAWNKKYEFVINANTLTVITVRRVVE